MNETAHEILLKSAMVERVMPSAMAGGYRSNWPIELMIESINTAYGYTDARSRFQPRPEDVTGWVKVHDLLSRMNDVGGTRAKWRLALIGRYRFQSGISLETDLMTFRHLSDWLYLKHDIKVSHTTAKEYVRLGLEWIGSKI